MVAFVSLGEHASRAMVVLRGYGVAISGLLGEARGEDEASFGPVARGARVNEYGHHHTVSFDTDKRQRPATSGAL